MKREINGELALPAGTTPYTASVSDVVDLGRRSADVSVTNDNDDSIVETLEVGRGGRVRRHAFASHLADICCSLGCSINDIRAKCRII